MLAVSALAWTVEPGTRAVVGRRGIGTGQVYTCGASCEANSSEIGTKCPNNGSRRHRQAASAPLEGSKRATRRTPSTSRRPECAPHSRIPTRSVPLMASVASSASHALPRLGPAATEELPAQATPQRGLSSQLSAPARPAKCTIALPIPYRRDGSATTPPGTSVACTISSFSSAGHRRGRSCRTRISIRSVRAPERRSFEYSERALVSISSVQTSVHREGALPDCVIGLTLTAQLRCSRRCCAAHRELDRGVWQTLERRIRTQRALYVPESALCGGRCYCGMTELSHPSAEGIAALAGRYAVGYALLTESGGPQRRADEINGCRLSGPIKAFDRHRAVIHIIRHRQPHPRTRRRAAGTYRQPGSGSWRPVSA